MKKMNRYAFAFLFIWSGVTTYFAWEHPQVQNFLSHYAGEEKRLSTDVGEEHTFLINLIQDYYSITPDQSKPYKVSSLKSRFTKDLQKKLFEDYERDFSYFLNKNGIQSAHIKKLTRNKINSTYTAFIFIRQSIEGVDTNKYFLKVDFTVQPKKHKDDPLKVARMYEKILVNPDKAVIDKMIFLDMDTASNIELPCKSISLETIKNESNVAFKVLPGGSTIRFNSDREVKTLSEFKVKCKKRFFRLKIAANEALQTLHHSLGLRDGVLIRRKIDPKEKLKRDIERELGLKITE